MEKIAYLDIRTWVGTYYVWYAQHYYGHIEFGNKKVELYTKLTAEEAEKMNKKDSSLLPAAQYKEGEQTSRFTDKNLLIVEAIKEFAKNSHGYEILIEGESAVCDPQRMLVGPEEMMEKANSIWEEFESFDGWNCRKEQEPLVEEICKRWEEVVGIEY